MGWRFTTVLFPAAAFSLVPRLQLGNPVEKLLLLVTFFQETALRSEHFALSEPTGLFGYGRPYPSTRHLW